MLELLLAVLELELEELPGDELLEEELEEEADELEDDEEPGAELLLELLFFFKYLSHHAYAVTMTSGSIAATRGSFFSRSRICSGTSPANPFSAFVNV